MRFEKRQAPTYISSIHAVLQELLKSSNVSRDCTVLGVDDYPSPPGRRISNAALKLDRFVSNSLRPGFVYNCYVATVQQIINRINFQDGMLTAVGRSPLLSAAEIWYTRKTGTFRIYSVSFALGPRLRSFDRGFIASRYQVTHWLAELAE